MKQMIQKPTTSSGGAMKYESEVSGFTGEQLEEYILSGTLSPIITESDGVDALSPKYELGRTVDHGRAWSISVDDSLRGCHLPVR
jgi:hypothetical protein